MLRLPKVAVARQDAMRGFRGFSLGAVLTSLQKQSDFAA
jgi:hypothetical protein